jgi:hypothetical protein
VCTPGRLTGELCKSNMCIKDRFYPDLYALDIPDPSNADFAAASAGNALPARAAPRNGKGTVLRN